jgi:hypothetical protein
LARHRGAALQTITADVAAWDWPRAQYDLIAWIYVHLPMKLQVKVQHLVEEVLALM